MQPEDEQEIKMLEFSEHWRWRGQALVGCLSSDLGKISSPSGPQILLLWVTELEQIAKSLLVLTF